MKKLLIILAVALIALTSCQTTKETASDNVIGQEQSIISIPRFEIKDSKGKVKATVAAGLSAQVIDNYLYVAGMGDLGYIVTSMNMAKSNCMEMIANYVNDQIVTAAENYAQGGGIVNSSSERDTQSVINNAVGTLTRAQAQVSGVEYMDYMVDENERVYVLARVSTDKISEALKNNIQSILRNDAAVQANQEAQNFFQQLAKDGIF